MIGTGTTFILNIPVEEKSLIHERIINKGYIASCPIGWCDLWDKTKKRGE
jgi:hypothetical protein